ncbi:MAG: hypothetical protein IBJ16_14905, partial [Chitinophagaceae bacterium]|nr:hypothetical protein [Chitinophagaceae bacterium]
MKTFLSLISFFFAFSISTLYGQRKMKEGITMQQLKANNYVVVSFDEIKYSRLEPISYKSFTIEIGDEFYTSLVDSSKNAIPLLTPIKVINYFDQYGWELTYYETSFTPDKPAADDKYHI